MSYRAFWQRRCRTAHRAAARRFGRNRRLRRLLARRSAGAALKPSGGNCAVLPLILYPLPRGSALGVGVADRAQLGRVVGGLPASTVPDRGPSARPLCPALPPLPPAAAALVHKLMPTGRAGLVQYQQVKGVSSAARSAAVLCCRASVRSASVMSHVNFALGQAWTSAPQRRSRAISPLVPSFKNCSTTTRRPWPSARSASPIAAVVFPLPSPPSTDAAWRQPRSYNV